MKKKVDVIIIGAGSVGTPAAYFAAKSGLSVVVVEKNKAPGRGDNRAAIGGIRATHSDHAKIQLCLRSLNIFSEWEKMTGDDIEWRKGGYFYPIYTESDRESVMKLLSIQKSYGLTIDWIPAEEALKLVPGLRESDLLGAIFAPNDGSASPLKSNWSFFRNAVKHGAEFLFGEPALSVMTENGKAVGVKTATHEITADWVVNAMGKDANELDSSFPAKIPLKSDCHEAGISEPVDRLFEPMIVDIRGYPGSKNIYFYQNSEGQIVFCLTPIPAIYDGTEQSTANFLPQFAQRVFDLYPWFTNLRIRRLWRGYYPNTPDANPVIDILGDNYIVLGGMCGQGFMLGPGIGEFASRIMKNRLDETDKQIMKELSLHRNFSNVEFFK